MKFNLRPMPETVLAEHELLNGFGPNKKTASVNQRCSSKTAAAISTSGGHSKRPWHRLLSWKPFVEEDQCALERFEAPGPCAGNLLPGDSGTALAPHGLLEARLLIKNNQFWSVLVHQARFLRSSGWLTPKLAWHGSGSRRLVCTTKTTGA